MKRWLLALVMLSLFSMLISCADSGNSGGSSGGDPKEVHTRGASFVQASITIPKGSMLALVDDDATLHIIDNGSWINGTPTPAHESGAPTVNNVQLSNNSSVQIGPFNTAGTYHLYCTIHQNMNLTIRVQ